MDHDEVRRRRMQRFERSQTSSSNPPQNRIDLTNRQDISADEAFARRLQAELDAESQQVPPRHLPGSASTWEGDAAMARDLQARLTLGACTPQTPRGSLSQGLGQNLTSSPASRAATTWQKDLAVKEVPDREFMSAFHFHSQASTMRSNHPGRSRHIHGEIRTLRESLPEGIFVRYAESRPDCMKILIVGPKDTPYADGLFEFDLICPHDYPSVPPVMLLRTTGGNTVGFNPNLYMSGKVCLSLLGTWAGEQWRPNQSTILQVLVSIQGLIFNEHPFTNEPHMEHEKGTTHSNMYNRQIHGDTVETAMLGWLHGRGKTMWDEVIKKHFKAQEQQILRTVAAWKRDMPHDSGSTGGLSGGGMIPGGMMGSSPWMPSYSQPMGMGMGYPWGGSAWPGSSMGPMSSFTPDGLFSSGAAGAQRPVQSNRGPVIDPNLESLARQLREAVPQLKSTRRVPTWQYLGQ